MKAKVKFEKAYISWLGIKCYKWRVISGSVRLKYKIVGSGESFQITEGNFWDGISAFVGS